MKNLLFFLLAVGTSGCLFICMRIFFPAKFVSENSWIFAIAFSVGLIFLWIYISTNSKEIEYHIRNGDFQKMIKSMFKL